MSATKESTPGDDLSIKSPYEELLQGLLRKHSNDANIMVSVKEVQDVVPIGDNYLSYMRRVFLEVSRGGEPVEEKVLIVKDLPKSIYLQNFVKEDGIYELEVFVYKKCLPEINKLCANVCGSTISAYSFDTGADDLLVMEDLKPLGYKMANRQIGLDFDHCKLVFKALARFHGASVSLVEADKSLPDLLPKSLFHKDKLSTAERMGRLRYGSLAEVVEGWPGFERFSTKLREISSGAPQKAIDANDPDNTELVVLNHGDCWLNNMLFKYSDSGEVEDIKFVDFQLARFASPAIDLHYFFVTSPNDEVRAEGYEALLEVYHSELCRVLEALGFGAKIVTLDWLKQEMKDKMFFAFHVACTILSVLVAARDEVPDLTEINDEHKLEENKTELSKSVKGVTYRRILQKLLVTFEKEGLL